MTCKSKTPTPFWGRSCAHFGDGSGIPCPHFGDALSLFWGRFSGFLAPPCAHFGDILSNHTPNNLLHGLGTKQAGRQVGPTYRTDGQPAWLQRGSTPEVMHTGPNAPFLSVGGTARRAFLSTHTAGLLI